MIRVWKTTEISQWSHLTGILTATGDPLPSDQEMWADVVYDGPLINLAVLSYAILLRASEGDVHLETAWKTLEILLKALGLAQVQASVPAFTRFTEVLSKAISECERGVTQITPLLGMLNTVISGLRLAEAFAYTPKPILLPRQIETIFGPEQLRNSELLEAFAAHLPGFVGASTPEEAKDFVEHLVLKNKLWEQLSDGLAKCFYPQVPITDKLRILMAFFDILDVVFDVLNESSSIDWQSSDLTRLFRYIQYFGTGDAPGELFRRVVKSRSMIFYSQYCHALLVQFSMQRSRGEPFVVRFLHSLRVLVGLLGVGTREDVENLTIRKPGSARTGYERTIKANATLSVALRDGPLSNFFLAGKELFDMIATESFDVTSDDVKMLLKLLKRMLDTPHLPLAKASKEKWVTFDHLRAAVRSAMEGNSQNVVKLQPLLDLVEKVHGMRPPTDSRAEGTGDEADQTRAGGPVAQGALRPGGALAQGSGRDTASHLAAAGLRDPRLFRPVLGTVPTTGMDQFSPRGWILNPQPNLNPVPPTSSIPTSHPGFGAEMFVPGAFPQYNPQVHPQSFAPAHVTQRFASPQVPQRIASPHVPQSFGSPHAPEGNQPAFASPHVPGTSMDPTDLRAQTYMQPGLTGIPTLPWHMLSNYYPSPTPSSGTIGALPPAGEEQHGPINGDEDGWLTSGFSAGDSTYLFICLRRR